MLCQFLLYTKVNQLLFCICIPLRSPQSTDQVFLCFTQGSHSLPILYTVSIGYIYIHIFMYKSSSPIHLTHLFLPQSSHIHSLFLCFHLHFANDSICTIFLIDSTYMCYKQYFFSFSDLLHFACNFYVHPCLCRQHNFIPFYG